jgi:hypothetical protein
LLGPSGAGTGLSDDLNEDEEHERGDRAFCESECAGDPGMIFSSTLINKDGDRRKNTMTKTLDFL